MKASHNPYHVASSKKLLVYLLLGLVLTILLSFFDRNVLRDHTLIYIDNYSSIAETTWQVQVTVSALTIAFVTIFASRLKETHYGFSLMELLCIKADRFTRLNFYETLIVVIALNALALPAVLLNSLMLVCVICCISMYLTIVIVYESLHLAMSDAYIRSFAKEYVYRVLGQVQNSRVEKNENGEPLYTARQQEYLHILTKLRQSLFAKAAEGNLTNTREDEDLVYFDRALERLPVEHALRAETLKRMTRLIEDAIFEGHSALGCGTYSHLTSHDEIEHISHAVSFMAHHYYVRAISRTEFEIVYYSLFWRDTVSSRCIFLFMVQVIKNADIEMLDTLLKKIASPRIHAKSDYLIHAAFAYMYYLSFCEPLYIDNYGEEKHELLSKAPSYLDYRMESIIKYDSLWCGLIQLLTDCFTEDATEQSHCYFQFFRSLSQLEIHSKGFKFLHMDRDIAEYCIFYLFTRYFDFAMDNREVESIKKLPTHALVKIRNYMTDSGEIQEEKLSNYQKFAQWLQLKETTQNLPLLNFLHELLKEKILEETKKTRDTVTEYRDSIHEQCRLLEAKYKKSKNYAEFNDTYDSDNTTIRSLHFTDILEHHITILSETDQDIFLVPFRENTDKLIEHNYSDANNEESLSSILCEQLNVLQFDSCYSQRISTHFMFEDVDADCKLQLEQLDQRTQCVDQDIIQFQTFFIYYDSSSYKPAFCVRTEFQEWLTDDDIDQLVQDEYEREGFYCIKDSLYDSIRIPCTLEEKRTWVRDKYFYIKQHVTYAVAQQTFGLVVSVDDLNFGRIK